MKVTKQYLKKLIKESIKEDYDTKMDSGVFGDVKVGEFIIIDDDGMDLNFVGSYKTIEEFKREWKATAGANGDLTSYGLKVLAIDDPHEEEDDGL